MYSLRVRLPFGTLKIKTYGTLRSVERDGVVPLLRIGRYYLLWWSRRMERKLQPRRGSFAAAGARRADGRCGPDQPVRDGTGLRSSG